MKTLRATVVGVAAFLLVAGTGFAQTTTAGAGTGGGGTTAGAPGGTSTSGNVDRTLDLPLGKPARKGEHHVPPPDNPPQNGDDKPPTFYGQEIKSETDTVFYVIDVSGSMSWDMGQYTTPDGATATGNRLDRAKAELTKSVATLPDNFKFNMLSFDCSIYTWQAQMVPADAQHKAQAFGWINALRPMGGTGTGPAVADALGLKDNKLVVLLTDGGPNCGAGDGRTDDTTIQAHRVMIRTANSQNAVINVFGINATDRFKAFCMEVAADNGGSYTDVR
jgi:hypothetical protein